MGDVPLASSITNLSFDPSNTVISSPGIVKFDSGIAGDIRQIELEFSGEQASKEGPVFNREGLCIGWISNHTTDIFALLYETKGAGVISLVTKVDYLYPLVKNIPGVLWARSKNGAESAVSESAGKDSLIRLDITKSVIAPTPNSVFPKIRSQIPEGVLFISVSVASGVSNIDFASKLLDALNKQKIGTPVSASEKQKYYQAIYERFGFSLTAEQLIKIASDLSNGYYLEAECNVVTKEVEDSVSLTLYQPKSMDVLAQVRSAKVIQSNPEEVLIQLTEMAVKELAKQLKIKKLPIFVD
jgi:hypothetical protein